MKSRTLHTALVWGAALLTAAALTWTAAALESLFPRGSLIAFLARTSPVLFVGPLLLAGFLAVCRRFDRQAGVLADDEPRTPGSPPEAPPARQARAVRGGDTRPHADRRVHCVRAGRGPVVLPPLRGQANCTPPRPAQTRAWVGQ